MHDLLKRVWENLLGRAGGPMHLRLIIQPIVATILAVRAGIRDARQDHPAFLWAAVTNPEYRPELVHQGWKDIGKVFIVAAVLDSIYQLIAHRGVYLLELLIVAITLAIIPYVLVRGPVTRLGKRLSH